MEKIDNFLIKKHSLIKFHDTLHGVYLIGDEEDYLEYLWTSKMDFKVIWALSNTLISPNVTDHIDILVYNNTKEPVIIYWKNGHITVSAGASLSGVCHQLLKKWYDCTHLLGIPGTIGGAVANNSWSGMLWKSIFDNIVQVQYYDREIKRSKSVEHTIFAFRNSEFKFCYNIFINKVILKFTKIDINLLSDKFQERLISRKKLKDMYLYPSLWTFYIKNLELDYNDILSDKLSVVNNKILNHWDWTNYNDYLKFKEKINKAYELEIEQVFQGPEPDYVWILFVDQKSNFLLQERGIDAPTNVNRITLFWGKREGKESIKKALQREVKEELNINIWNDLIFLGLFLKNNKRCFVFYKKIENMYNFREKISCSEWRTYITNISSTEQIRSETKFTETLKKVLFYYLYKSRL